MKIVIFLMLFLTSSSIAELNQPNAPETMQTLTKALSEILTSSSSQARFTDPANHAKIAEQIKQFSTLAHTVKNKLFTEDKSDPTIAILSNYLSESISSADSAFKNGNSEYAREIIKSIPGTCISCHSRKDLGSQFKFNFEPSDSFLTTIERAEFYASTRQFDRAGKGFLEIIENPTIVTNDPYSWELAIKRYLVIAIRIKKDPVLAKKIITTALTQKKIASTTKEDLIQWKKSITKWMKEPKASAKSEKSLYSEGKRLTDEAHQLQKYPMDHSADILYLRASFVYYDLIQLAPNGKNVSKALLMEGISNEVLSPR